MLSHKHRRLAARLEEDIVVYDYRAGAKAALPAFAVEAFRETFQLQQAEMARAREKIWRLIGQVEELERETWDSENAVEDMGGAAGADGR